jgi:hypothetical protein
MTTGRINQVTMVCSVLLGKTVLFIERLFSCEKQAGMSPQASCDIWVTPPRLAALFIPYTMPFARH